MTSRPYALLAAYDTAASPDRIAGTAHVVASSVTSRRWALLPAPGSTGAVRFAVTIGDAPVGEVAVHCRAVGARWSVTVDAHGELNDTEVHTGIRNFVDAFTESLRQLDATMQQIARSSLADPSGTTETRRSSSAANVPPTLTARPPSDIEAATDASRAPVIDIASSVPGVRRRRTAAPVSELDDDIEVTRMSTRHRAQQGPAWTIVASTGQTHEIRRTTVIGRRPAAPDHSPDAELLTLPDPERLMSKSHAVLECTEGDLWITDLGSMNGTEVHSPDGSVEELSAHRRHKLADGDTVHFAEITVRIAAPPAQ